MTSEALENPIQITNHIKTTLCLENYKENYPPWQKEIFDVLGGHGLLRYVLDSNTRPSPYLADGITSAEFERWKTQDQLIWYWMCSFVPTDIRTNLGLLAYDSSHLLWKNLQSMYTSTSFPSVPQLELRLQTIKKGDATCAKYLDQIQQIADCLRSLGSEMSEQDLVRYTLLGLGQEFNHFEWPVKLQCLTMKQLEKHLLSVHMAHYCSTAPTNVTSFLNTDTDQALLENVAGLGAEDSDIARSLPRDTSCLPVQIRDPAAGGQVSMPLSSLSSFERQVLDSTYHISLTSILNMDTDQTHLENVVGFGAENSDIARSLPQDTSCLPVQTRDPAAEGQVSMPFSSFERQVLDSTYPINFTSILNTDTDQAHLESGAGLGAEDSNIARSLPQDTSCLPLQTRDPAAGGQAVIIKDDEEDAD